MKNVKIRQMVVAASESLNQFNNKTITPTERSFLMSMKRANRNSVNKKKKSATGDEKSMKGLTYPIPHLPPYASQYRDLMVSYASAASSNSLINRIPPKRRVFQLTADTA